jgi:hypothetical protein
MTLPLLRKKYSFIITALYLLNRIIKNLILVITLLLLISGNAWGKGDVPDKKRLNAIRTTSSPVIDGVLDDEAWVHADVATDFIQYDPVPGAKPYQRTEVRVLYDDNAIYIGAILYDTAPDSILKELSPRDQIANTDWFSVQFDTYLTGQNAFEFIVTPSGIQIDRRLAAPDIRDHSWDAVWISEVKITSFGWVVELEIPYAALRFPQQAEQNWYINFGRYVRRVREECWWNEKRPEISNELHQNGILQNLFNIKSPPRVSVMPFVAAYLDHNAQNVSDPFRHTLTGGMDVKVGLSDAFTLDMALIPDFGQVRFDDQILNLTPFEIQFEDNRPFFTEGTELFERSNIFYSRRIGDRPFYAGDIQNRVPEGATYGRVPINNQLINASKLSGRTNQGLGIGVFNAVENRTWLNYTTTEGEEGQVLINPLSNYNVFVLDQTLPNNSYISLVNTHVWREGPAYDASVTALETGLRNRDNSYMISGNGIISARMFAVAPDIGHSYRMSFEKTKGTFQYRTTFLERSANFNPNDLGFLARTNERTGQVMLRYNIFSPWWFLNRANITTTTTYQRLHTPDVFYNFVVSLNSFFMTRKFFAFGLSGFTEPVETYDYFEPRTRDFSRFYAFPVNHQIGGFISTDYRRKFAYDINTAYRWFDDEGRHIWNIRVSPRLRVNDHFFITTTTQYFRMYNEVGFVPRRNQSIGVETLGPHDILFARRHQDIIDNLISARINFNPYHNITLRMRHYWTRVNFNEFFILEKEGGLGETAYTGRDDQGNFVNSLTYNLFNVDLVYTWRFAPGSDIIIVWKNALDDTQNLLEIPYTRSVGDIFSNPQFNSISFKMIYYLDYAMIKRRMNG